MGNEEEEPTFEELVENITKLKGNWQTRKQIIISLGRLNTEEATNFLHEQFGIEEDRILKKTILLELARKKDEKSLEIIFLAQYDTDKLIQITAQEIIQKIERSPNSSKLKKNKVKINQQIEEEHKKFNEELDRVREALDVLTRMPTRRIVEFYIQFYDKNVQEWLKPLDKNAQEQMKPLIEVLEEPDTTYGDEQLQRIMFNVLPKLNKSEDSHLLSQVVDLDHDWEVISDAISQLGKIGSQKDVRFLGELLLWIMQFRDFYYAYYPAHALGRIKGEQAVDYLITALKEVISNPDRYVYTQSIIAIVQALGEIRDESAMDVLNELSEMEETRGHTKIQQNIKESIHKIRKG